MNKSIKGILIIVLLFIIIYFLQINFFSWFNISGVMPNLFVILVLFIGLFVGNKLGGVFGLAIEIILDITFGRTVGVTGVLLAIIGLIGEYFDKNFSKDNRMMIILVSIACTILFEVGMYIFKFATLKIDIDIPAFAITLLIENLFNSLLIIIFYTGIKKIGYYLEDTFKGRKLLTRYF